AAQWDYLEKNESCAMVASAVRAVSPEGNLLAGYDFRPEFVYYNLTFGCWIFHPTVVYRRSAIQELGGYTQFYGEDFTLWSRLLRNHRFHVLPEVLLDYRVLPKSLCREKEREYAVAAKA